MVKDFFFFPTIFLEMFNQYHFLLLVRIPEIWNKLERVLGKLKAIVCRLAGDDAPGCLATGLCNYPGVSKSQFVSSQ